jgi:putative acyl-CoA dehydrogenase
MAEPETRLPTHEVLNQPPPRPPADPWADDPALRDHLGAQGGATGPVAAFGARLAAEDGWSLGEAARRHPPEPVPFDRGGRRLDEVHFHPAYHRLMAMGAEAGYAALPWRGAPGGHVAHAAMVYLLTQAEPGVCCPLTMTYAAVPALAADEGLAALWTPRLTAPLYDPAPRPVADKAAATLGMAMTEKQGGSDLRGNSTWAERDGEGWRLTGHKWFCSAPMSDGFLTLAQAPGGLTCFLMPRWTPDGGRNAIRLQRLKDKLGNRANASAEIELERAWAQRLGTEGDGIRTILAMVHHTRLDAAVAPAGLMRAALREARHWCAGRVAFQRRLIDQPLMRAVLADLVLDWEGALALSLRVAAAFDRAERPFARLGVALAKFLANKRCVPVVAEAMEALGGMGYVEETPLPALYREAPLNGIWEGSGNVIALDLLRSLAREPQARAALEAEFDAARGADRAYDAALATHRAAWARPPEEAEARRFADEAARLLTASVLLRWAPPAVGEGYVRARLGLGCALIAGAGPPLDASALLARLG